ncbi:hypothetical protein F5Y16DRAFT_423870 [Xylariaceae sp. FL0255]|nr:hypothetical protein F5Y16DRAFT_423870 [Xylariaceae sp. FL0255]
MRFSILSTLATAVALVNAADGPYFSTGPTASNTYIVSATSTLTLPELPSGNSGDLSLWVGMGTSKGDLIQSIAETYDGGGWIVYAYTLLETSPTSQEPVQSASHSASPGDEITMDYVYSSSTGNYTQYVSLNGVQVATLSTSDGFAEGWGSAVECAAINCGTVPSHTWTNTKIVMNIADPDYIDTNYKTSGVTGTMSTSDGGLTWTVSTITIPEYTF